jgi:hypothetical protein
MACELFLQIGATDLDRTTPRRAINLLKPGTSRQLVAGPGIYRNRDIFLCRN